jgi:hypothetical protein
MTRLAMNRKTTSATIAATMEMILISISMSDKLKFVVALSEPPAVAGGPGLVM